MRLAPQKKPLHRRLSLRGAVPLQHGIFPAFRYRAGEKRDTGDLEQIGSVPQAERRQRGGTWPSAERA